MKRKNGSNAFRTIIAIVVILVWLITMFCSVTQNYEIPISVNIGFTIVLGFIYGNTAIGSIIKFIKRK